MTTKKTNNPQYVLGIDQGLANLGYSIISDVPSLKYNHVLAKKYEVVESGVLTTTSDKDLTTRLKNIFDFLKEILEKYNCIAIGCEKLFHNDTQKNGRNKSAAIVRTNMVTGVIFLLGGLYNIPVFEFVPGTVKKNVTGKGNATKDEVIQEIENWLNRKFNQKDNHEADSIGIGISAFEEYDNYIENLEQLRLEKEAAERLAKELKEKKEAERLLKIRLKEEEKLKRKEERERVRLEKKKLKEQERLLKKNNSSNNKKQKEKIKLSLNEYNSIDSKISNQNSLKKETTINYRFK